MMEWLFIVAQEGTSTAAQAAGAAEPGSAFAWCVGLLLAAVALGILEMFVPSFGTIGLGALVCAIAGVIAGWTHDPLTGLAATGFVAAAGPTMLWVWVKVLPHTPVGKRVILSQGDREEDQARREVERRQEEEALLSLVGARGTALTELRPGGTVRIEGEDVEAFAEIGMISAGSAVEIVSVAGRQIKVRAARQA